MIKQILMLFVFSALCHGIDTRNLKLKQVITVSRHNIRTPYVFDILSTYSPKKWPKPNQRPGQLTQKGARMERYMGRYFKQWFESQQFLQEECPSADSVYVCANSMNRTIQTAEAFVESAFKNCNVSVYHRSTTTEVMDPMFIPIIRNTTDAFKNTVLSEMHRQLNNTKLKAALLELNEILDIKHSEICKSQSICDLADTNKNKIYFKVGSGLQVDGPMFVAIMVLDSFSMNYYEGLPTEEVAWGLLDMPKKWKTITEIGRVDQDIRYTTAAKDFAAELINYLTNIFLNKKDEFISIVGHDFNQNALINSMGFKPFRLPNHYELNPIGGHIVFQKWTDNENDYLKIEYIYPSWTQIRNGSKFSLEDPPQRVLLQLKWCNVDENGFCPWSEFINKLRMI